MIKLKNFFLLMLLVVIIWFVEFMVFKILLFHFTTDYSNEVTIIDTVTVQTGDESYELSLPYTFENISENETVTLSFSYEVVGDDILYFKTTYCPVKLFIDGELTYQYGQDGTFPDFVTSPIAKVQLVQLQDDALNNISIEYSPASVRSDMELDLIIVGSQQSIIYYILTKTGLQFITACFLSLLGIFLVLFFFLLSISKKPDMSVLWLGLSAFLCGIWGFGESDLSGLLVMKESILYVCVFIGISLLAVPIQLYLLSVIKFKHDFLTRFLIYFDLTLASTSIILQSFGILSFYQTLPVFIALACVIIIFAPLNTYYEWKKYDNQNARNFLVPYTILAFSFL